MKYPSLQKLDRYIISTDGIPIGSLAAPTCKCDHCGMRVTQCNNCCQNFPWGETFVQFSWLKISTFLFDIFYLILSKASATAQLTRRSTESGQTGGPGRQTAQRSAPDPQYREVFLGGLKLKLELSPLFLAQAAHTNISYICYEVPFMQFVNKLSHVYCVCQLYTCYSAVKLYSTHALLYLHPPKVVFVIFTDPYFLQFQPALAHYPHATCSTVQ